MSMIYTVAFFLFWHIAMIVTCAFCTLTFDRLLENQLFCSKICRKKFSRNKNLTVPGVAQVSAPLPLVAPPVLSFPIPSVASILLPPPSTVTPLSPRTMRIAGALSSIGSERFMDLAASGARYSPSTLKKHDWVIKLYEAFCERAAIEPWPLDPSCTGWFIRFLGLG